MRPISYDFCRRFGLDTDIPFGDAYLLRAERGGQVVVGGADLAAVFVYFVFLGAGLATGVGMVALLGWKIVSRSRRREKHWKV